MKDLRIKLIDSSFTRLIILYLLFAGLLVGYSFLNRASVQKDMRSGTLANRQLSLEDFETVQAEVLDSMAMINDGYDTQIIYTGEVRNIYIKCRFSTDPGEFVAFYNKTGDNAWSENRQVWAKQDGEYYCFEFPKGTRQIRIDTGVEPSIRVDFEEIEINRPTQKLLRGMGEGVLFIWLIVPLLVESVLGMVVENITALKKEKVAADE